MAARNQVIDGSYSGYSVRTFSNSDGQKGLIFSGSSNTYTIKRENVSRMSYVNSFSDGGSALKRGAVGFLLFGGIGLLGAATAKTIYQIRLFWNFDAQPSLLEIDENIYNFMQMIFY